jgi:hypothetical protein
MQFSIARLLLITLFVNIVVAATFVFPPLIGISLLTFVALFVVPPFIIVGAFNTRGLRQSFFLGAMISGTAHFVINVYLAVILLVSFSEGGFTSTDWGQPWIQYLNGAGFLLGSIGGLSGMTTYCFLKLGEKREVMPQKPVDWEFDNLSQQPDIYPESSSLSPGKETSLPR